jgi:phosphoglycerate dehydrogenase-like enzyme
MNDVIATPHIGNVSKEAYEKQYREIFEQIVASFPGSLRNVIDTEALNALSMQ